jgi:hypothetical protein
MFPEFESYEDIRDGTFRFLAEATAHLQTKPEGQSPGSFYTQNLAAPYGKEDNHDEGLGRESVPLLRKQVMIYASCSAGGGSELQLRKPNKIRSAPVFVSPGCATFPRKEDQSNVWFPENRTRNILQMYDNAPMNVPYRIQKHTKTLRVVVSVAVVRRGTVKRRLNPKAKP